MNDIIYSDFSGLYCQQGTAGIGITPGKDDVTNSRHLRDYCYKHTEELKATPVLNPVLLQLMRLVVARTCLQ